MNTTFTGTFEPIECGVVGCGIYFGISPSLHRRMRDEGVHVHCPNGHNISYCESALDKVKKRLAQETHAAEQARADRDFHRELAKHHERSARTIRGHHTRLKRRVAAGVCPCCHRSFQDLARHMGGKHPHYGKAEV